MSRVKLSPVPPRKSAGSHRHSRHRLRDPLHPTHAESRKLSRARCAVPLHPRQKVPWRRFDSSLCGHQDKLCTSRSRSVHIPKMRSSSHSIGCERTDESTALVLRRSTPGSLPVCGTDAVGRRRDYDRPVSACSRLVLMPRLTWWKLVHSCGPNSSVCPVSTAEGTHPERSRLTDQLGQFV